ncbi:phosphonoacetaldehyde hydrolase [Thalassospira sp. TSL5-1]|uniref:phosphonoacetaldehyde hydrolase n=1 Tax=Thalassospira sp. TSL5-1 TaxID=1544451 RepID=UPI00093F4AD9|nr:phosphonoacetaldehyde hydrolase [Thalassospira sp. TSL5-1]OKH86245.1 phosphonoacetaldehyde hydrolase [Thalassospira sp. TSL5-1]
MSKLVAAVFDWAGTLVDFGSRAPMGAFVDVFRHFGVEISIQEARAPMGRAKRDHIAAILTQPRIAQLWQKQHGKMADDAAIDAIYDMFIPLNTKSAIEHSDAIPGAAETVAALRKQGLKIGSTTGYTRPIMKGILPLAQQQGITVDNLVCAGEVPEGRPSPLNMYKTFLDLGVWPAGLIVKIDDTPVGIAEGVNAGCWTVGVTLSGNETGLSLPELNALSPEQKETLRTQAGKKLRAGGAHYLIDSVADLLPVLDKISHRIASGALPEHPVA